MDSEVGANDIYTATQISQLTAKASNELGDADAALTQAERDYDRLTMKALYHTGDAHQASFKEHAPIREKAEDAAYRVAKRYETQLSRVLSQLQHTDRNNLTPDEHVQVNARAALVREDIERARLADLAVIARRAIQTGDRAEQFLVARYARQRLKEPQSRDLHDRDAGNGITPMVAQIEEGFRDRSMDAYRDKAAEARFKAEQLRRRSTARPRELRPIVYRDGTVKIPYPRETN